MTERVCPICKKEMTGIRRIYKTEKGEQLSPMVEWVCVNKGCAGEIDLSKLKEYWRKV